MKTIQSLLEETIAVNREYTVIFDDSAEITYGELEAMCEKAAGYMMSKGVQPGDKVACMLPRNNDYVVVGLTCMLYGFCLVLMDPAYPAERINSILENSKPALVIDESVINDLYNTGGKAERTIVSGDTPAAIYYTSGSTGNPKGVLHDQYSLGLAFYRVNLSVSREPHSRYGIVAPATFVAFFCGEIFLALSAGGAINLVPREVLMDPDRFSSYIQEKEINNCYMPPKVARIFKRKGDSLHVIYSGSERVTDVYSEDYDAYVIYGMTEAACVISSFKIDQPYSNTPIGKAMDSIHAYILSEDNKLCEVGEEGELCLAGHFFTEYIGMPENTAEVIVPNPFYGQDGQKIMFRTGDIVRMLPDGNMVYVNRKDWMLKINGQRVEPGEIETVMKMTPGVRDAAVKSFEDASGRIYLCGYYVGEAGVTDETVMSSIQNKVPAYMFPEVLVKMEAFPVNNNGKIDRKALKAPERNALCVMPENEAEDIALKLAKQLMAGVEFGVTDNLQFMGMDSVKSMEYSLLLEKNGIKKTASTIMRYKNIRDIMKQENQMIWLLDGYDKRKKTLVVASGIVVLRPLLPFYEKLSETFNVVIIEPVQDHYDTCLKGRTYDEIIELYTENIRQILPDMDSINAFMGFSFGGEQAASLACRYGELCGKKLPVIVGDTFAKDEKEYTDHELTIEELPEEALLGGKEKAENLLYRANMINSFGYGQKYACYDGPVLFIDARKGYTDAREEAKIQKAGNRYKNMKVIPMNDYTHSDLFRDFSLVEFYQKLISEQEQ